MNMLKKATNINPLKEILFELYKSSIIDVYDMYLKYVHFSENKSYDYSMKQVRHTEFNAPYGRELIS